jgi:hypothetical protein
MLRRISPQLASAHDVFARQKRVAARPSAVSPRPGQGLTSRWTEDGQAEGARDANSAPGFEAEVKLLQTHNQHKKTRRQGAAF